MNERDKLRTTGTPPQSTSTNQSNRNDIRIGANGLLKPSELKQSELKQSELKPSGSKSSGLKELSLDYNKNVCNMVGVLIVNLNNLQLTKNCIDSLKKQINLNFQIYLFDQNSDERGTKKFLDYCKKNDIYVYRHTKNIPLNHIWNNFKNISDCEYLCFLNNDVIVTNTFIDDTIKILDNEPTVGAVIHVTNNGQYTQAKNNIEYTIFSEKPLYQGWDFTVRREIMPEIPTSLKIFGGDDYIFAKINTLGHKIAIAHSSPIIHYKERTRVMISDIAEIQRKDAKIFSELIRRENLIQIDSTMNHGISYKYPQPNMTLSQNKNCVFTAVIGDYDGLTPTIYTKLPNWDYICFTDNMNIKSDFWRVIYIKNSNESLEKNVRLARYYKTNFFTHLSSYENLIWMDARITISHDINEYVLNLNDNDIVFLKHPNAASIMEEFNRVSGCIERADVINEIKERYLEFGYNYDNGLVSSGVLLFKNNERVVKFFREWWYEINNYSHRDQLSANFVLWRNPDIKYLMLAEILNYRYFKQLPRNTKPFRYE